jgi:hypothetical protein
MPYYVEVSSEGKPVSLLLEEPDADYEPSFKRAELRGPLNVSFEPAPWPVPDAETRVGGTPNWAQGPESAGPCPKCSTPMEFLAQFADDSWGGDEGMLYAFGCTSCRICASFVQA